MINHSTVQKVVAGDIVADSNHHRDPAACNGGGKVTSVGVKMTHTGDEVNCVAGRMTGSIVHGLETPALFTYKRHRPSSLRCVKSLWLPQEEHTALLVS